MDYYVEGYNGAFFSFSGVWLNDFIQREFELLLAKELEFHTPGMSGQLTYPMFPLCNGNNYILDYEIRECRVHRIEPFYLKSIVTHVSTDEVSHG
jgi:hypothetical protein